MSGKLWLYCVNTIKVNFYTVLRFLTLQCVNFIYLPYHLLQQNCVITVYCPKTNYLCKITCQLLSVIQKINKISMWQMTTLCILGLCIYRRYKLSCTCYVIYRKKNYIQCYTNTYGTQYYVRIYSYILYSIYIYANIYCTVYIL